MATKSDKTKKAIPASSAKDTKTNAAKPVTKSDDIDDDGLEDDEEENLPKKAAKGKAGAKKKSDDDVDDEEDDVEVEDEWEKPAQEDADWDPDFEEFDIPKSKTKKAVPGAKKAKDDDDLGLDDDFKEFGLFDDADRDRDRDDDDDF